MTQTLGAMVVPIAPAKNRKARKVMLWRRPQRSDMRPPSNAPSAAPTSRVPPMAPSSKEVSWRPLAPRGMYMYGRAPEMTPVS